jgi:hypothetical protein
MSLIKLTFLVLPLLFLVSCAKKGSTTSQSSTGVVGVDLSGVRRVDGIECYDTQSNTLTAYGTVSSSSSSGTDVISGNTATSSYIGNGGCRINTTNSIVANLQEGDVVNGGYGTIDYGESVTSIIGGSSCTISLSFDMIQGAINPSTISMTHYDGDVNPAHQSEFVLNPPYMGFATIIQVVGRPTDLCLLLSQEI